MEKLGLGLSFASKSWKSSEEEYRANMVRMLYNDVVLMFSMTGESTWRRVKALRAMKPGRDTQYGNVRMPPILIEDLDDNIDYVNPLNPRFATLGTRLPGGRVLKAGDRVSIDFHGEPVDLWRDGEGRGGPVFDIARNHKNMRLYKKILRNCHGLSFATERLRRYFAETLPHENTYAFPNSVIFEDYSDVRVAKKEPNRVRILWQGGDSHYGDWYSIKDPIGEACRRIPALRWVVWGSLFRWATDMIPDDQFEFHDWVPYPAYRLKLAIMDFDIAVAPLVPNQFNESKSAIKWYEASALPEPKPVLAANVPPYSDEIEDGKTGFLYASSEEFLEKLGILCENPAKRKELAENAKDWIREHRAADVTVPLYHQWLCETRARVPRANPDKDMQRLLARVREP